MEKFACERAWKIVCAATSRLSEIFTNKEGHTKKESLHTA